MSPGVRSKKTKFISSEYLKYVSKDKTPQKRSIIDTQGAVINFKYKWDKQGWYFERRCHSSSGCYKLIISKFIYKRNLVRVSKEFGLMLVQINRVEMPAKWWCQTQGNWVFDRVSRGVQVIWVRVTWILLYIHHRENTYYISRGFFP